MPNPTPTGMLKLAQLLMGQQQQPQQQQSANPFSVPFTGMRNAPAPTLPPFQVAGQTDQYLPPMSAVPADVVQNTQPPAGMPATAPAPVPEAAPMPPPEVPPMPPTQNVRGDVMAALQELRKAGRLPEQWRGAFANQYGEPT